jgi:predicted nucleic acid-binding protein
MQPPRLVAVDSNVLLALAVGDDEVRDAWEVIRSRLRPVMMVVPPTVIDEIGHKAAVHPSSEIGRMAARALRDLRSKWMMQPVELRSDQDLIAARAAAALLEAELLPPGERNDAAVIAQAAVLECALLVSEDSHLHGIDRRRLKAVLAACDLTSPLIASPREIVRRFYR